MTENEKFTLEALHAVLSAYKDYGKIAAKYTDEYKSLTLVRKAIRRLKEVQRNSTKD